MARQYGSVILGAGAATVLGFAAAALIGGNLKLTGRAAGSSQPAPPYRSPSGITGGAVGGGAESTGGSPISGGGPSAPASSAPPPSGTSVGSTQPGGLARPL